MTESATGTAAETDSDDSTTKTPWALAIFLIIAGAVGWYAAFQLTLDKFLVLEHPGANLNCDISVLVQCGKNLSSAQGAVFGFPNPLLGLGGFAAPIAVGLALLAGARFARWFWLLFNLGIAGALAFVIWLISVSVFILGTLCPWCMLVWSLTIPLFITVTLHNLKSGNLAVGARGRRFFSSAYGWIPLITVACYLVIAVIAQLRLDVIHRL